MTEESFANAIEEVLSNPSWVLKYIIWLLFWIFSNVFFIRFQEKAMIQSSVYRDQPMKPLDRAVYWVEYVIQNGGAKHLKSVSIGLNDLQYFLFDVSLVLIVTTGLIVWLCFCIVKFIIKTSTIISAGSRILFTRCKIWNFWIFSLLYLYTAVPFALFLLCYLIIIWCPLIRNHRLLLIWLWFPIL